MATLDPSRRGSQAPKRAIAAPMRALPGRSIRSFRAIARAGLPLALALAAACGESEPRQVREPAPRLPLEVMADTAAATRLPVPSTERARAWLRQVSLDAPVRVAPPPVFDLAPPDAPPEAPPEGPGSPDELLIDEGLKPPILMRPARLILPEESGRLRWVDLDVRVDETGAVGDARWAGESADTSAVRAAIDCARAMRFHPALQRGRPVAVWCRQRFEFGRGSVRAL